MYEIRENLAEIAVEPNLVKINYYNVTINIRFWNRAKVYAIRVLESVYKANLKKINKENSTSFKPLS